MKTRQQCSKLKLVSHTALTDFLHFLPKNKKQNVLSHWYMLCKRGIGGRAIAEVMELIMYRSAFDSVRSSVYICVGRGGGGVLICASLQPITV